MKATITFPNAQMARSFASAWAYKTLTGHDMSAVRPDGSRDVTVYDVDEYKKQFIDNYINNINRRG